MRIYGGHDFYDSVLAHGSDPKTVLVRGHHSVDPGAVVIPRYLSIELAELGRNAYLIRALRVVFCGKVYHGLKINAPAGEVYFWRAHRLRAWLETPKKRVTVKIRAPWRDKRRYALEDYFAVIDSPPDLRQYMIQNRYAILLEEERDGQRERYANPHSLHKIGFVSAIDPYTAYQELSMWVGGVLAGESPRSPSITDDKALIEGHGFDYVSSFRGPRV